MTQTTLDQGNQLWSSGAVGHLFEVLLPMVIFGVMMAVGIRLCRSGVKLVGQAVQQGVADAEVAPLETDDGFDPAGRARGYDGFDPSMYGPAPTHAPEEAPEASPFEIETA